MKDHSTLHLIAYSTLACPIHLWHPTAIKLKEKTISQHPRHPSESWDPGLFFGLDPKNQPFAWNLVSSFRWKQYWIPAFAGMTLWLGRLAQRVWHKTNKRVYYDERQQFNS
jgi:hypothetical protein